MRGSAVELLDDCPHCLLEGGLVETYDARIAACRFGVPARVWCKLCGVTKVGRVAAAQLARDLSLVQGNRCPACLEELAPEALDVRRCAACGAHAALLDERGATDLRSREALVTQLDAWAVRDGFPDLAALVSATFVAPDLDALMDLVLAQRPLETLADPFSLGGRAGGGSASAPSPEAPSRPKSQRAPPFRVVPSTIPPPNGGAPVADGAWPTPHAPHAPLAPPARARTSPDSPAHAQAQAAPPPPPPPGPLDDAPPQSAPPRAILFPLVSVVAADGEVHAAERAFVDAFLATEGMAPLQDDEFRVYTPAEAARYVPKERREKIVELMCELAAVDGLGDEAELRVVRAYAAAWRVPEEKVETWLWGYEHAQASAGRQFWLRIRRFLLSSRWEKPDP